MLFVSPHFPPVNAPDHQRIRGLLPYLQANGWAATVLTVEPAAVEHPQDERLRQRLSEDVDVVTVSALPVSATRKLGLGNLGLRCWPYFLRAGNRLLAQNRFDLILFSTTIFPVMTLGPIWKQKFGVPYLLDFQDPWRVDRQQQQVRARQRPGGRLKYAVDKALARVLEPVALRSVDHVISVSAHYPQVLRNRYPWLWPEQFTVLPFGAPTWDFQQLTELGCCQSIFDPDDGYRHWVYVGRGGDDMEPALRILFAGIQQHRQQHPQPWATIRIHFVGTSYATSQQRSIQTLAATYGLDDIVTEQPQRIPYFEAQQLLIDSEAILLVGSKDPSYSASKLYASVLAQRPILALFHPESVVTGILQRCQAGTVVKLDEMAHEAIGLGLEQMVKGAAVTTDWSAFAPYTDEAMSQKLCRLFDAVVDTPVMGMPMVGMQRAYTTRC